MSARWFTACLLNQTVIGRPKGNRQTIITKPRKELLRLMATGSRQQQAAQEDEEDC